MGVYEGRGQLAKGMKELMQKWLETKSQWQDAQAKHFEENCLLPLEGDLRAAGNAMDHMAILLQQIQRDCRDTDRM
jgi:hypothetical protein